MGIRREAYDIGSGWEWLGVVGSISGRIGSAMRLQTNIAKGIAIEVIECTVG